MRELPTSKILVQVLAAEEHLVDIAGAWDVPGGGAYLFQGCRSHPAMSRLVSDLQPWNMQAVRIADGRPMAGIKTSTKCSQLQKSPPACWTSEVSSFERSTNRRFLKFKKGLKSFSVGRRPKSIPTISRLRAYVWHARPRLRCRERKRRGRNTSQRLY